ncbi:MAG: DUF1800 domain-containing protein, partial [Saprospiraceae bacterium]|nr:DUF1800 domain-containing protein [Saprospiraceae bacterium]
MDRRTTIATLIGKGRTRKLFAQLNVAPQSPPEGTLAPYTGAWGYEQAAHLLRRAMFGPTYAQIKDVVTNGMAATVSELLQDLPMPAPPVNPNFADDPSVPIGATWIDAPYSTQVNVRNYRNQSLRAWTLGLLLTEGISIREKMTLFWHNHFSINVMNINDPKFFYKYVTTLRTYGLGNFRNLVKAITIDPSMLRFLNGNQNTKNAPNENYARELMELFTLGKGELAGPGDYTTFTEHDVIEMARVLTGWRDRGHYTNNVAVPVESYFLPNQHDTGSKQLSHRFNNVIINNLGDQEYAHLVDIIFQKPEVARFISRKLYRWFVYYEIDAATEQDVIEPMAQLLISNNYEIKPAIEALLKSEHFYNVLNFGPMIKNPLDFMVSAFKQTEVTFPPDLARRYNAWFQLFRQTALMQMEYYNPPDVAGWKAYYQEPSFYRVWINASTLPHRMTLTNTLAGNGYNYGGFRVKIDTLKFIKTLDDPYDPNHVVEGFAKILFPQPLIAEQIAALKEVLIPGLPDYEWGVEYTDYESDPNNA